MSDAAPKTRWHITFGTYAGRLHGGDKPTVDRRHNAFGEPQIIDQPGREKYEWNNLADEPVLLTAEQRVFVESILPELCSRGGWDFVECAAAANHVHVVADVDPAVHGKRVRAILKRWLTQALNERWRGATRRADGKTWWAEGGSARAVHGREYRQAAEEYVRKQRTTRRTS
jgi:REP element-mobilizing transposase RayT